MRRCVLVLLVVLALGCKQKTSESVDVAPSASASSAITSVASGAATAGAITLDPKLVASTCARLTEVPRVAERCTLLPSDGGNGMVGYSFRSQKGAEDQADGIVTQIDTDKGFANVLTSNAEQGRHHCENDAHHLMIVFVGTPSNLAEVSACERLKSIP